MALTTSGAIKAFLEGPTAQGGAGLTSGLDASGQPRGVPVYQDQAPENMAKPYVVVDEAIVITPDALEDGAASTGREHVTLTVWMDWKKLQVAGTPRAEDPTLAGKVAKALQGSRLLPTGTGAPPTLTYGVLIHSVGPRILDRDANVVRVPIWVELWRAI